MSVCVILFVPVLIGLGLWQIDRAGEKRDLEDGYYDRLGMLAQAPPEDFSDAAFRRIALTGEFELQRQFLLDNRLHEGLAGYWVITSFVTADGRRWLINRGWVQAPAQRADLPEVAAPQGMQTIVGVLWPATGLGVLLADDPWPQSWPLRVQRLNVARMADRLGGAVAYEVRLEAGQPGALTMPRLRVTFSPEKNQGYAVQWFLLAATLLGCYGYFGLQRRD
ncbi:MAG: SURF1 family protein [Gammaproteobacteria bacterium]|nr:SURF1 family protein [Gammaproteobacteria bacterium]